KLLGQKKTATHIKICTSCPNLKKKKCICEAGEMAQQLRALVALPEDLGSVPRTDMAVHNHL
ncbi:hypothetical protein ACQP3J_31930, partial [Escherichia coli]